jgi:hypothetical protein
VVLLPLRRLLVPLRKPLPPQLGVGGTVAYCHFYDPPAKPRAVRQPAGRKAK